MTELRRNLIERLFAEHGGALQRFFYRRIRSKPDSADLVQEVYLRMLRVKDTDAIRNPEGYLYTVAANLLREHAALYQHQSATRVEELAADDDRSATLEELFDTQVRAGRLRAVLGELSPKCRAAVHMKYQHGLSYEEIADHMGLSVHMVQKYLGQALAHCRRRMTRLR